MSFFNSIRTKFMISVFIVALLLTSIGAWFIYNVVGNMLFEEIHERIRTTVRYGALRIDNWFSQRSANVDMLYYTFPILEDDEARQEFVLAIPGYPYVGFSNEHAIFSRVWDRPSDWYPTARPWFIAAMENRESVALSPVYIDADTGELTISLSRYLGEIDGYDAVLAMDLFLPEVLGMVWDSVVIDGSYAFLVDQSGNIITHTEYEELIPFIDGTEVLITTNIRDVDKYREYYFSDVEDGELLFFTGIDGSIRYMVSYYVSQAGWTLHISVPYDYVTAGVTNLTLVAFLFFGVFIITLVILMYLSVTRLISTPLAKIGSFAKDVADGLIPLSEVDEYSIDVDGSDEVGAFARILEMSYIEIHNSNEIIRTYLNSSPMYIELWDENGNIFEVSQKVADIYELSDKDEYIRRHMETYPEFQPDGAKSFEKQKTIFEKLLYGSDEIIQFEWMHKKLDSEELIPVDVTLVRFKRDDKLMIIGYNHDLRPIKEALRKEMQATEENKAKTRFLARISHEMRTPLNAILGIAQMQLWEKDIPDKVSDAIENIHNAGNHLFEIINDTLDMSKIEMGEMKVNNANYDLPKLINDIVSLNIAIIGSKPIELIFKVSESLPQELYGDEHRIKQILNNLISNAIKYTSQGHIQLTVSHTVEDDDVCLCFEVEDTGQGIKDEDLSSVFVEYLRFNPDINRDVEGTGLGLSIAKRLAELMGGTITAKSTFGEGSTFSVSLMQKAAGSGEIGEEVAAQLRNVTLSSSNRSIDRRRKIRTKMSHGHVLIVDDMKMNLHIASGLMAPYQLNIETAESGFETIEKVKSGKEYDIIFMDHMMPGLDGTETMHKLHELGYDKPIVVFTANAMVGNAELFIESGFDDFIAKPIDIRRLDAILNKYVRDRDKDDM